MTTLVATDALNNLLRMAFQRAGLGSTDAAVVAEALVDANLRGNDSHGVARAPAYLRRVAHGAASGSSAISEVGGSGPLRRLDAGAALGPLAASRAAETAIELAGAHGIGLVAVGNSSHLGAAGFYARRMAQEGKIGFVATNGPANMAPFGSSEPFLGTNAFAVGVPLPKQEQFVLDLSCSVAARGKIIRARELGRPINYGLAIDAGGKPTRDPVEALAGAVLPFAGPKGSGLALAITLAVGVLGSASFDYEAGSLHGSDTEAQDIGHILLAIDPWSLAERDQAERRVSELIDHLHDLRPSAGFDRVAYPGEHSESKRRTALRDGIAIADAELDAFAETCNALGYSELVAEVHGLLSAPSQ